MAHRVGNPPAGIQAGSGGPGSSTRARGRGAARATAFRKKRGRPVAKRRKGTSKKTRR